MSMRGIRGAITVEQNEKEAIWQAARAMMQELIARNELAPEDIGAVIFSMTELHLKWWKKNIPVKAKR